MIGRTTLAEPSVSKRTKVEVAPARERLLDAAYQLSAILILVGTADSLLPLNRVLHDRLEKAGKKVRMEIYENGYHDFVMGPQGQNRPDLQGGERLMDITLQALESALKFVKQPTP